MANSKAKPVKSDAVFIRISSPGQNEKGQIDNVRGELAALRVQIPDDFWFSGVVKRRKVRGNEGFNRLMELVEADRIGTVYIESQDRWGTADRVELFTLLGILRQHDTRLFDLRAKRDLTERDVATEMMAFIASVNSERELQNISFRSLRTRVNSFKETGSWPTGTHPFGYGKACYSSDKRLLWVWQPVSRSKGQILYPDERGKLKPGPADVRIPRKTNRDRIVLVPSSNREHTKSVQLIFDLYTRLVMSRRQISKRLNDEGRKFYTREFSHTLVTMILTNPAYVGDTHFGKTQTGELHTFNSDGLIVELKKTDGKRKRDAAERIVRRDTHEALISRKTWEATQTKLASEQQRISFAPRNPAYYLKPLLVCGHCGKNMAGRSEVDPSTKQKRVVYVCQSWMQGRCDGRKVSCGYHRILHDDAERLLLEKIAELNLQFDPMGSERARESLQRRMSKLDLDNKQCAAELQRIVTDGIDAFARYINETFPDLDYRVFQKLRKRAAQFYWGEEVRGKLSQLPVLGDVREAILDVERRVVDEAERKLSALTDDHKAYTRNWALATEQMQVVLKQDIGRLEAEIVRWRAQTVLLTTRLQTLYDAEAVRSAEREKLQTEWPALENRERGEALRRVFNKVTLYWTATFRPARAKADRPRKTNRPGRYSYHLQRDRIEYGYAVPNLGSSW